MTYAQALASRLRQALRARRISVPAARAIYWKALRHHQELQRAARRPGRGAPVSPSLQKVAAAEAGALGAPGLAIAAAQRVDDLINRIDNPFVTAAVAPVFLGTAALKGIASAASAVVGAIEGIFDEGPAGIGNYKTIATPQAVAERRAMARAGLEEG